MGADLIVTYACKAPDAPLNFEAARAAVLALTNDELYAFADQAWAHADEENTGAIRDAVYDALDTLGSGDTINWDRSVTSFVTPDNRWEVIVVGGTSWGDDPSEDYTALSNLWAVPSVLRALGFATGADPAVVGGVQYTVRETLRDLAQRWHDIEDHRPRGSSFDECPDQTCENNRMVLAL